MEYALRVRLSIWTILRLLALIALAQLGLAQEVSFKTYASSFSEILGPHPKITLLSTSKLPLFHEAAVYHHHTKALFCTSDYLNDPSINNNQTTTVITRVTDLSSSHPTIEILPPNTHNIPFPNSGYNDISSTGDLVWLGQGNPKNSPPGGVFLLNPQAPYNATNILSHYGSAGYFNSPNDVAVASDGSIFFTDPIYGSLYGNRPKALLPNQVYRYDPRTESVRVVADGFIRPNGIGISPGSSVVYVGDTGALIGDGTTDFTGPRTIYAFDVQKDKDGTFAFLGNRRVFAMPDNSGPDGIKSDSKGNVYSGVGDGVAVWNASGELLGKILIAGGVGNLGFGEAGVLWVMGGNTLFRVNLSEGVVGAGPH